jgi:hypothetical protein
MSISRARASLPLVACAAAALVSACGSSTPASRPLEPMSTGEAFDSESCSVVRPPTEPDLMGWDPASRANLKSMREQGVVAVRYEVRGCDVELEVLSCTGEGSYGFSAYSANDTKVSRSERDLQVDLPIGAARLASKVGSGRALRTDYALAGVFRLPSYEAYPVSKLRGVGCGRATHVVATMYVGGFGMAASASERLAAGASVFGVGGSASLDEGTERVAFEGDAEACSRSQREGTADPRCSVPLRIALVPVAKLDPGLAVADAIARPIVNELVPSAGASASASSTTAPAAPSAAPSASARPGGGPGFPPLSEAQIADMVARNGPRVRRRCYYKALETMPPGTSSRGVRVTATVDVEADGSVTRVTATGGKDYPGLDACVAGDIQTWTFPPSREHATATIPFIFAGQ